MNLFSHKQQDTPGRKQTDRYKPLGSLGKGRDADITSCFDRSLNRIVALKQLRRENLADDKKVTGFLNEAKVTSYLDHPCVVTVFDAFTDENKSLCYTMKQVSGNTLLWEMGKKTRGQFLAIFTKICEALAFVHDKGVVHLDLNTENILIGQYGEVMLSDWGNARLFDKKPYLEYLRLVRDAPPPPENETDIPVPADPRYASPEQMARSLEGISPSADIFSMGTILYQTMSGALPFDGPDFNRLATRIQEGLYRPLHETCPDIPRILSQICAKMLAKDPFIRYHSFHEVLRDIDQYQNSGQAFSLYQLNVGDVFVRTGDPGDFAFTVVSGSVEVSREVGTEKKVLAILGPGEIVGELAIFTNEPRTATVMAIEPTTIRIMDRGSVEQEMQKLSPWVQQMITALSKRFIRLNEKMVST